MVEPGGQEPEAGAPRLGFWQIGTAKFLAENWVMHAAKGPDGRVRVEDALGVLGSLAGFSVIAASRQIAGSRLGLQRLGIMFVTTTDGSTYHFGGFLNQVLLEHPTESLFAHITAPLRAAGVPVPDTLPIVKRVAETVGSDHYGVLDLPPEHTVDDNPVNIVSAMWASVVRCAALGERPPQTWTATFAEAIRLLNERSPGLLDDTMRARIVLECALRTAHLDPDTIMARAA